MKIIAHRGACTEALENSWDAFNRAIEIRADRIELDVHLTKDGHLAVMHDENLMRTSGTNRNVADLDRSTIEREIRLTNGESVPFLDEIFAQMLTQVEINVEIKSPGEATTLALANLINKQADPLRVIVSSFFKSSIENLTRDFSEIRTAFLWDKKLWWPWSFYLGPRDFMRKSGVRIFHPDALLVTPNLVENIKKEGWEIYPYISLSKESQREKLWTYLMTIGVDGLCTNYPREMLLWRQEAMDDRYKFSISKTLANIQV